MLIRMYFVKLPIVKPVVVIVKIIVVVDPGAIVPVCGVTESHAEDGDDGSFDCCNVVYCGAQGVMRGYKSWFGGVLPGMS